MTVLEGRVTNVWLEEARSEVKTLAFSGFTLEVVDAFPFTAGQTVSYDNVDTRVIESVDYDNNTLTFTVALDATPSWLPEDPVYVQPYGNVKRAMIDLSDGGEGPRAYVPFSMYTTMATGIRELWEQEAVLISDESGRWEILSIDDEVPVVDITGGIITGTTFQTGTEGRRVVITPFGDVEMYSGLSQETDPAKLDPSTVGSRPYIYLRAGETTTYDRHAYIRLASGINADYAANPGTLDVFADVVSFRGVGFNDAIVDVFGDLDVTGMLDVFGNVTVDGGVRIGAQANRTFILHSASINLTVSGAAGLATWNHNLALGTLTYQCLVTSRTNGAARLFTIDTKNANSVVIRIENPTTGNVLGNGASATCDILIIG